MKPKKVLITGSDGFIGSHLAEGLVRSGYSVRAMVQYNPLNSRGWLETCSAEILRELEVIAGDIRDPFQMRVAAASCDAVAHLAALISIPYSYRSPSSYLETNVNGTLNILEAARSADVGRLIITSTSEVYGTAQEVPITEAHSLNAQSPYAASKVAADQLALAYYASFKTPVVILRPFNTYGPRQSARAVIPTIIGQLASRRKAVKLGSVTPTRDFSFVTDTVMGFTAALEAEKIEGEVINLGSNFEISIKEVFDVISNLMGCEASIEPDDNRVRPENSEVQRLWADNSKAKRFLRWCPKFSGENGLRRGLELTIDWFSDPKNLLRFKNLEYNI